MSSQIDMYGMVKDSDGLNSCHTACARPESLSIGNWPAFRSGTVATRRKTSPKLRTPFFSNPITTGDG